MPVAPEHAPKFVWDPANIVIEGDQGAKFDDSQPRDENGRWTSGGALDVYREAKPLKGQTEPRELPAFGLSQAAIDAVYKQCESKGVTHEALVQELKDRIGNDPQALAEASKWYEEAHADAQAMADRSDGKVSPEQAQAVIAAISPRTSWEGNLVTANACVDYYLQGPGATLSTAEDPPGSGRYAVIDGMKQQLISETGHSVEGLNDNIVRGFEALQGASPDEALDGLKVRSFYNNIDDPGGTRDVTIDGHMTKIFGAISDLSKDDASTLLLQRSAKEGQQYAGAGYIAISEAVRAVSTDWGVPPDTVQAAYWLKVRETDYEAMKS